MRTPSRYMPTYNETLTWKSRNIGYIIIAPFFLWLAYGIWDDPIVGVVLLGIIFIIFLFGYFSPYSTEFIDELYAERKNEDIGTFTRLLDYRNIDTWIIRAVYEEVNSELGYDKTLPIRPSDHLENDLKIDIEGLEFILTYIFARVGISDKDIEKNPYFGKIETVGDIIHFCNTQPKEV